MKDSNSKYIEQALIVFKSEGLQISLTQLAERMGITKKTLYNHFDSKEKLLASCINYFVEGMSEQLQTMLLENTNAVEGFYNGFNNLIHYVMTASIQFMQDVKKLYPLITDYGHLSGMTLFTETVQQNTYKGISEGLYRSNFDVELISKYFVYSTFEFLHTRVIRWNDITVQEYFHDILDYHLNSITTEKGKKILKKLPENFVG